MEEWKEIKEYDGLYLVSNYGNIKKKKYKDRGNHYVPERIVKQRKDKNGYCIATLYDKEGQRKDWKVHRLVAITFISNPDNLPQVNHKNEIKDCNFVGNLEWCTSKYNANYGLRPYKISIWHKGRPNPYAQGKNNYFYGKHFSGEHSPSSKKVAQYSIDGKYIKTFSGMNEAGRITGVNSSAISMCCRGIRKTSGGYIWKYA